MRISDWSSDVCSSDLAADPGDHRDALDQPDEDRLARRHIGDAADVPCLCETLDEQDRKAADDQCPGDDDGVFEHYFDIVAEGEAEDHRRKKGEQIGRAACRERVCQYV